MPVFSQYAGQRIQPVPSGFLGAGAAQAKMMQAGMASLGKGIGDAIAGYSKNKEEHDLARSNFENAMQATLSLYGDDAPGEVLGDKLAGRIIEGKGSTGDYLSAANALNTHSQRVRNKLAIDAHNRGLEQDAAAAAAFSMINTGTVEGETPPPATPPADPASPSRLPDLPVLPGQEQGASQLPSLPKLSPDRTRQGRVIKPAQTPFWEHDFNYDASWANRDHKVLQAYQSIKHGDPSKLKPGLYFSRIKPPEDLQALSDKALSTDDAEARRKYTREFSRWAEDKDVLVDRSGTYWTPTDHTRGLGLDPKVTMGAIRFREGTPEERAPVPQMAPYAATPETPAADATGEQPSGDIFARALERYGPSMRPSDVLKLRELRRQSRQDQRQARQDRLSEEAAKQSSEMKGLQIDQLRQAIANSGKEPALMNLGGVQVITQGGKVTHVIPPPTASYDQKKDLEARSFTEGNKTGYTGLAPTSGEAVAFREQWSDAEKAKERATFLIEAASKGKIDRVWWDKHKGQVQTAAGFLRASLRKEIAGPGAVSEYEQKLLQEVAADPSKLTSLAALDIGRLSRILVEVDRSLSKKAASLGLVPVEAPGGGGGGGGTPPARLRFDGTEFNATEPNDTSPMGNPQSPDRHRWPTAPNYDGLF